jgi:nitrous oxide reductase accessory protein NosL
MKRIDFIAIALLLVASWPMHAGAGDMIKCTECGMPSDLASKFTAKTVEAGKNVYFCDIGDLLVYLNKKNQPDIHVEVKDYPSGAWIDAGKASFVQASKQFNSPMGWGIAAFKDKKDGSGYGKTLDLAAARKAVR